MKLLFLTIINIKSLEEKGIYTDLLRKFRNEGHEIFVVSPIERRYHEKTQIREEPGATLLQIKSVNFQKSNLIEKGIGTLIIEHQYLVAIKKYFSKQHFDLILYSTPPITFSKVINYIKARDNAYAYLLLKDIFPQNAVDLGMFKKHGMLHKFFIKKEKELYKYSDFIGCMSEANVDYVKKHNPQLNPNIIEVNPNSIEPVFNNLDKEKKEVIRKRYQIPDNTLVFIYGGNLGKPQGIDFLIQVLESNLNKKDIFFVIAGNGIEFKRIDDWFKENNPTNALLFASLPKNEYDNLLKATDVGLIFLDKRFTIPNFPSRLLSYLENKMPVIAATDINTDLGKIIEDAGCGFWCESGDLENFNKYISRFILNRNKISQMGENSYKLLMRNYTVDVSYNAIINKICFTGNI